MKMDATLKYRIRKVAATHFGLTVLFVVISMLRPGIAFSGNAERWRRFQEQLLWQHAWDNFWADIGYLLQPQFWLFSKTLKMGISPAFLILSFLILSIVLVPVWSICFGWIYVKFTNWLNNFPVLGKKVF
jgi:Ni,Fe-hydrogenase I cytochrome b subunit